jgi:hypothetical protein
MQSMLHGRRLGHQQRLLQLLLQSDGSVRLVNAGEGCVEQQGPGLLRQLLPRVQQRQLVPCARCQRCAGDADWVLQGLQLLVLLPLLPCCRMGKRVSRIPGRS